MVAYVIRRLGAIIVLAFGVSLIAFSIIHLIPGDPVAQMIGYGQASAQETKNLHHQLGLDQPLPLQYIHWLGNVLQGNFGYSYYSSTPVVKLIEENLPYTIELAFAALIVSISTVLPVPDRNLRGLERGLNIGVSRGYRRLTHGTNEHDFGDTGHSPLVYTMR